LLCTESVRAGWTDARDESTAVAELYDQIGSQGQGPGFFFCSPRFDLERMAAALRKAFGDRLVGCTTAGEITPAGYREGSLTGFTLSNSVATLESHLLTDIRHPDPKAIAAIGRAVRKSGDEIQSARRRPGGFGMLLIDGRAMSEERMLGLLKPAVGDLPLIGGSVGDGFESGSGHVYHGGRFHAESALFCHVKTERPIHVFHTNHFEPTDQQLITTSVDAGQRVVHEFNGRPAAEEYGRLIGHLPACLDGAVFANHPLMIKVGREHYVRSIRRVTESGGLQFFCPVEEGLLMNGARGVGIIHQTQGALADIHEVLNPDFIVGFDCILRRLELQNRGLMDWMSEIMVDNRVVGFSTWGEQFGGIHLNQSFTGVAIGR
jgi:hypothetical protein